MDDRNKIVKYYMTRKRNSGEEVELAVEVDMKSIAKWLGGKAVSSKNGKATAIFGAVRVTHVKDK